MNTAGVTFKRKKTVPNLGRAQQRLTRALSELEDSSLPATEPVTSTLPNHRFSTRYPLLDGTEDSKDPSLPPGQIFTDKQQPENSIRILTPGISYVGRFHSVLHSASKSRQIHVIQDVQNGRPSSRVFGVVLMMKITYADSCRLVGTCSLCPHAPSLRQFVKADYSSISSPAFKESMFMGCQHTRHVVISVYSQVMIDYDLSPQAIEATILDSMTETNTLSCGWLEIPDELPISGNFAVHISDDWEAHILKVQVKLIVDIP